MSSFEWQWRSAEAKEHVLISMLGILYKERSFADDVGFTQASACGQRAVLMLSRKWRSHLQTNNPARAEPHSCVHRVMGLPMLRAVADAPLPPPRSSKF